MSKAVHNDVLDSSLTYIKTSATRMVACSTQPTSYTEANATYNLASVTIGTGDFTGPADGDVGGRKLTVATKTNTIGTTGTARHVALLDVTNTKLLYVSVCAAQALTAGGGNTVGWPAWEIEIEDPV